MWRGHQLRLQPYRQPRPSLLPSMHPSQHRRKQRSKHAGLNTRLRSWPQGSSLPSILLANVNPGISYSATQPGGRHSVPGHGHHPAGHGGLGDDAVLLRLPLHVGVGEAGEVCQPTAVLHHAAHQDLQAGWALCLATAHWCCLTWEVTPRSIYKGITTAIMNSDCLVFVFSQLWSRRRYRIHQASTERLRKSFYARATGSWMRTLPENALRLFYLTLLFKVTYYS